MPVQSLLIGITGGMGAGKSTVATLYREQGYPVLSADEIAREIVSPGAPALSEIAKLFGTESLAPDGTLNRSYVREKIAQDPDLRRKLERITHPRIQNRSLFLARQAFGQGARLVFYEAPLLFEAKSDSKMDKVICVRADDNLRLQRIMDRDDCSREQALLLLSSQMSQEEKIRRSDYLIDNSGTENELKKKALALLNKLSPKN
ncbi:MAG TPA: dephospho-CoA kinase [Bdellovibrionota bacterium]|jgi:dephospho-CoA kinase